MPADTRGRRRAASCSQAAEPHLGKPRQPTAGPLVHRLGAHRARTSVPRRTAHHSIAAAKVVVADGDGSLHHPASSATSHNFAWSREARLRVGTPTFRGFAA